MGSPTTESGTVLRPRVTTVDVPMGPDPVATGRTKGLLIGGGVALLVIAGILAFALLSRGGDSAEPRPTPSALSTSDAGTVEDELPPGPVKIKTTRADGAVTFTWDYSAKREDDDYRWKVVDGAEGTATEPTTVVPAPSEVKVCLQVIVVRRDGSFASKEWSQATCG